MLHTKFGKDWPTVFDKMLTDDRHQPIAISHLSNSGDVTNAGFEQSNIRVISPWLNFRRKLISRKYSFEAMSFKLKLIYNRSVRFYYNVPLKRDGVNYVTVNYFVHKPFEICKRYTNSHHPQLNFKICFRHTKYLNSLKLFGYVIMQLW